MAQHTCDCGHLVVRWREDTLLDVPPAWWPEHVPYDPINQTCTRSLCLWCGRHSEEIH